MSAFERMLKQHLVSYRIVIVNPLTDRDMVQHFLRRNKLQCQLVSRRIGIQHVAVI